jgi:hypothetical protein
VDASERVTLPLHLATRPGALTGWGASQVPHPADDSDYTFRQAECK